MNLPLIFPMRLLILCLHPVVFHVASAATAPALANWQSTERTKILAGVSAIPKLGAPGPVAIWGPYAFPVIAAGESGKPETALVAASGFGKGRILIFGHNSYLDPGNGNEASVGALLVNSVKWMSTKQKPRVGVHGANAATFLESKGFLAKKIAGALDKKTLHDFDVILANVQSTTSDAEGEAVMEFVKDGGGLIAGMTGWAFEQTSGGKRLNSGHGLNKALMAAGVAFTDASGFGGKEKEFSPRNDLPPMMNAQAALDAMLAQQKGGAALSAQDFEQGGSAIHLALSAQAPGRSALQGAALGALGSDSAVPTAKKPLTQEKDAAARNKLGIETRVLKLAAAADIKLHAAAKTFPGIAPADAPRVTREVTIHPNIPGWTSTGLWVNGGDPVTVKVPAAMAGKGLAVRIGCHSDSLYHLDKWERAPEITRSVPIETEVTVAANAFGGLVYIEVPDRAKDGQDFNVTIAGAIEAPQFVLGRDDDAKWNGTIKIRKGPWTEFACDKVILCCPTENARHVTNPTELMAFWKKVVEAQDEFSNQTDGRKRPERIVCDVQISAGYMHSGYPIMVPVSAADEMITFHGTKAPGWGFYHELGHNHQRGDFTFEGTGEVTNNVIGMYVLHSVLGKDPLTGHPAITPAKLAEHIRDIKKADDKFALWKKEPFLALTTYIQLVEGFGWDAWRNYLSSFANPSFGPAPKNDDEKRDQFLVRYSKITGKNLGDFFDWWGIPVSSAAKAEVGKLERWMPRGLN